MRNIPTGVAVNEPSRPSDWLSASGLGSAFRVSPCGVSPCVTFAMGASATCCCGVASVLRRVRGRNSLLVRHGTGERGGIGPTHRRGRWRSLLKSALLRTDALCRFLCAVVRCGDGQGLRIVRGSLRIGRSGDSRGNARNWRGFSLILRRQLLRGLVLRTQIPALLMARLIRAVVPMTALRWPRIWRGETFICTRSIGLQAACDQRSGDKCDCSKLF